MNQEDAFIQAILQDPDDDASRLVYADWLEEQGSPRSDVIRERCRIAGLPDSDRLNLETILRQSWADYWNEWVEYCGLVLTWDRALAVFERRLAETVAWCDGRNPDTLRTPALRPESLLARSIVARGRQGWSHLLGGFIVRQRQTVWSQPTTDQRQRIVNALANRRVNLLPERREYLDQGIRKPSKGRLVLFDPDDTLSDGAAESESHRYFDVDNVPAWDTWVFFVEDGPRRGAINHSYLVAWVPSHLVEAVNRGIQVNPEECIRWGADVDTTLTRKLREAGLLV